jgi:hypothetical protein
VIDFELAIAIRVLSVVLWIGGVAMVTTVILPAVRRLKSRSEGLALFDAIERRFAWQARATAAPPIPGSAAAGRVGIVVELGRERAAGARFGEFEPPQYPRRMPTQNRTWCSLSGLRVR